MKASDLICYDCGKPSDWLYMPASDRITEAERFRCDDHVPRGCSCNSEPVDGNWNNADPSNWEQPTDEKGRRFPCCEWFSLKEELVLIPSASTT